MPWPRVVVAAAPSPSPLQPPMAGQGWGMPRGCLPCKWKWDVAGLIPPFPAQMGMAEQVWCSPEAWLIFWIWALCSGTSTQPCGLLFSRYKSMGDSRQGGRGLGHHVLPAGLRSGPWGCICRCHRSGSITCPFHCCLHPVLAPLSERCLCRGGCAGTHVACDKVLGVSCSWDYQYPRTRLQCQGIAGAKLLPLPQRLVQNVTCRERERCGLFELAMSQAGKARWGECVPACLCVYK